MKTPVAGNGNGGSKPIGMRSGGAPALTVTEARAKLATATEELGMLVGDLSPSALNRKGVLKGLCRQLSRFLYEREPDVVVTVPPSVRGEPFFIGRRAFHPGKHTVKASEAQMLLYMISLDREGEMRRFKDMGRNLDMGHIGGKASMATATHEPGVSRNPEPTSGSGMPL